MTAESSAENVSATDRLRPATQGESAGGNGNPQIAVKDNYWCRDHLRPFRDDWPRGYMIASILLFQTSCEDESIVAAAQGDAFQLQGVLDEFSPLCCRLPYQVLRRIYDLSLRGGVQLLSAMRSAVWRDL